MAKQRSTMRILRTSARKNAVIRDALRRRELRQRLKSPQLKALLRDQLIQHVLSGRLVFPGPKGSGIKAVIKIPREIMECCRMDPSSSSLYLRPFLDELIMKASMLKEGTYPKDRFDKDVAFSMRTIVSALKDIVEIDRQK